VNVSDVMTRDVVTVGPGAPLKDVSRLLLERRISGVPVVAGDQVVGVVSDKDILYKEQVPDVFDDRGFLRRLFDRRHDQLEEAKRAARTAGDAMSSPAVTIRPHRPVTEAATLMLERGLNRLPVVDDGQRLGEIEGGRLVGIVTHSDLMRAFARPDSEIAAAIHEVIAQEPSVVPEHVTFDVSRGEVHLEGDVEYQTSADALVSAIDRVPGVVTVDSRLEWREKEPTVRGPVA
jgi:CBS domain-containing protein